MALKRSALKPSRGPRPGGAPEKWVNVTSDRCAVCGGTVGLIRHHAVTKQAILREGGDIWDPRDCLIVCDSGRGPGSCHQDHHSRKAPIPLACLRDETFEFARELFGGPAAHVWLSRTYSGSDPRLDALLDSGELHLFTPEPPDAIRGDLAA